MLAAAVSRPLLSAAHSLTGRDSGVTLSSADCWVLGAGGSLLGQTAARDDMGCVLTIVTV